MQHTTIILFVAFLTACGGRYGRGLPENSRESEAWAEAIANTSAKLPEMTVLSSMVGRFNYETQFTPYPGAKPVSSRGTCTFKSAYKDRWLIGDWNPELAQGAATKTFFMGYSNARSRYLMGVIGANPTSIGGEGVQDQTVAPAVAIDFEMSMPSPADQSKRTLFKRRVEVKDKNTVRITDYRSSRNGVLEPYQVIKMSRSAY